MPEKTKKALSMFWIILLCFGSGYTNITTMLRFDSPSSHMTGISSQLALNLFYGNSSLFSKLLLTLLSFVLGATLSGFLFHERKVEAKKRYGVILFLAGILIFLLRNNGLLFYGLAFFMGIQNAMFLVYKNTLVRNSHLTGYFSDIGFELGSALAGKAKHPWKIAFYSASILLFILGGLFSAYFYEKGLQIEFLSGFYILLGTIYFYFRKRKLLSLE